MMGFQMVTEKAAAVPGFPDKLLLMVQHLILSHHGELAFGSPKVPVFAEAMLLHQIDSMDSKMETMRAMVEHDNRIDGNWTGYNSALERAVLKKVRFLDESPPVAKPKPGVATPVSHKPQQNSLFADKLTQAIKSH